MTDLPLEFPILALVPDYGAWATEGLEDVEWFFGEEEFIIVPIWTLKHRPHTAMLLVDISGRAWRVAGVADLGAWGVGWMKVLRTFFRGDRHVRYDLVEQAPIPFETIRDRVAASIQTHPDHWRDDEAIAGEAGPPRDEQEMLDEKAGWARQATNMRELIAALQKCADDMN